LNKPETTPPTYFHHIRDGTQGHPDQECVHYTEAGDQRRAGNRRQGKQQRRQSGQQADTTGIQPEIGGDA